MKLPAEGSLRKALVEAQEVGPAAEEARQRRRSAVDGHAHGLSRAGDDDARSGFLVARRERRVEVHALQVALDS
jgi:hypothetical protein